MRIIKHGTPPGNILFRVTCDVCSSQLEFAISEASEVKHDHTLMWKIDCPVCYRPVYAIANVVYD